MSKLAVLVCGCLLVPALEAQTWIRNPANGHHYTMTKPLTWAQAKQEAARLGGELVTIRSAAENDWVYRTFRASLPQNTYVYIGMTDEVQEGTWVWSSGESATYTNWAPGKPDNAGGKQNYGTMWDGGKWDDDQSNAYRAIIERIDPAWIRDPANGHHYAVTRRMTWKGAEAQAVRWGGHLATVRSKAENDWIYNLFSAAAPLSGDGLWIGYTDEAKEGTWIWKSGETSSFTNWRSGEPSNGQQKEHFAHIWGPNGHGPGLWNDAADSPWFLSAGALIGVVERRDPVATFSTFGKGCASTSTLPTISSSGIPRLGQSFPLEVKGFIPKPQAGQLIIGVSSLRWGVIPLPLSIAFIGAGNCNLLVSLDNSFLIVTDSQGHFSTTFAVPNDRSLLGTVTYGQAWMPDLASNPLGLATSNAFKAVVGY